MAITSLTRTVTFDTTKLKDIPSLSAQALKEFYARIYPEILTATTTESVTEKGIELKFATACLVKG